MRAFGVSPPPSVEETCGMSLLELGSQVGEMCATAQGREAYCLLKQTTRDAEQRRTLLFGAAAGAAGGLVLGLLIGRLF